jgi:hypothetical protein
LGAGGDGRGNGATVTVGAGGVIVGAGGVVGLEQAASAKPISITIDRRMSLSDTTSKNLMSADRGEHRQAAGAITEAVIRSVELIVQPNAT